MECQLAQLHGHEAAEYPKARHVSLWGCEGREEHLGADPRKQQLP